MKYAVGIDIGGTNTRVALFDQDYQMLERKQFPTNQEDPMVTMKEIKDVIDSFNVDIEGIGLSCPGPLDLVKQQVLTTPNLPGWHYFEISKELSNLVNKKVILENDANLAGLAEAVLGAGKGHTHVQFFTISTGLGGGLILDKKIYHGARGYAEEIANCIFWKDGPSHGDLMKGSIESISSGTAITTRGRKAGLDVEHAGQVNDLALQGNETAKQIMDDAYEYLANLVAAFYGILDPDIFVLSGSVALKIEGFVEKVEQMVKERVYPALKDNVKVVKAQLDEDCGLIGAAYLILGDKDQ